MRFFVRGILCFDDQWSTKTFRVLSCYMIVYPIGPWRFQRSVVFIREFLIRKDASKKSLAVIDSFCESHLSLLLCDPLWTVHPLTLALI